jgi:hypothetical protein
MKRKTVYEYQEDIAKEVMKDPPNYYEISELLYKIAVLNGEDEQHHYMSLLSEGARLQKISVIRELKKAKDQSTYLGISDIAACIKEAYHPDDIALLKLKL